MYPKKFEVQIYMDREQPQHDFKKMKVMGGGLSSSGSLCMILGMQSTREMLDFDGNPFVDSDLNNPFKDPSVTQVTRNVPPGLDEYNPFSDSRASLPGSIA